MRRRTFLLLLAALGAPVAAKAQESRRTPVVGILWSGSPGDRRVPDAFLGEMRALGYVEGQSVTYHQRWGRGSEDALPALAAELVALRPDVIVVAGVRGVTAVRRAGGDGPIVVPFMSDLVGTGTVAGLARPGGNITGLTGMSAELGVKRLELLREMLPGSTRVAVIWNSAVNKDSRWAAAEAAARALGLDLASVEIRDAAALDPAFARLAADGTNAVMVFNDRFTGAQAARIIALAAHHRLPTIYDFRDYTESGGLISYGPNVTSMYRRSAVLVDKILRGARPEDIPIEQPARLELIINLATARALGLEIPQALLARADEVIE